MTKTVQHISLKKSAISGKVPAKDVLAYGELAVNYGEGGEKIFLQNTANNIVEFSSDGLLDKKYLSTENGGTVSGNTEFKGDVKIAYPDSSSQTVSLREVMVDNEMTVSAALNDLNTRIEDQKKTVDSNSTIIGNISTKVNELLPLSGGTVSGETTFTKDTTFDNIKLKYPKTDSEAVSLRDVMLENEKVTAAALNDLNERVNDHKSDIDAIKTKEYLPLSGGTIIGNLDVDGDLQLTPESNLVSHSIMTDKLTSDDGLYINDVQGITSYKEYNEVNVWTTDGKTKPLSEFLLTSGGTVSGETTFTKDVKVVFPNSETPTSLVGAIVDNEEVIAAALNDLNDKVANISIINAPLIIKDGNKKYNVNIAKGIELGLFTEIQ